MTGPYHHTLAVGDWGECAWTARDLLTAPLLDLLNSLTGISPADKALDLFLKWLNDA